MPIINKYLPTYKSLLKEYIDYENETSLYKVEQMSKSFIRKKYSPEEIISLHSQALTELFPHINQEQKLAMNFLLQAITYYGVAYQEVESLRDSQSELKSEIALAASVQQSLLSTDIPCKQLIDVGVISVPASQMNGDYYHFFEGKDGSIGMVIADVVGKGIPAALCMSMIKYSLDSFPEDLMHPGNILKNLNRVVERNVDANMFITMFCAIYQPETNTFTYASAGHEPGFYCHKKTNSFSDLFAKGLVLGVLPDSTYAEKELYFHDGDMIVLLTDGVTESRRKEAFIEREYLVGIIKEYCHLPSQQIVNKVYQHFERLQDFKLDDDFTLLILKHV